jgi:hypothetical protein
VKKLVGHLPHIVTVILEISVMPLWIPGVSSEWLGDSKHR